MAREESTQAKNTTAEQATNSTASADKKRKYGFFALIYRLLHSDGEDDNALKQWKSVSRQLSIDGQWFKKQIGVLILAVFGTIAYITCRFQAQQEMILIEQLQKERIDWEYRSLTRSSQLTLKTRQSLIESSLKNFGDSTLEVSVQPPIITTVSNR